MTTYLYWLAVIATTLCLIWIIGYQWKHWQAAFIVAAVLLLGGYSYYHFYFENVLVQRWGGVMDVTVPKGQHHLSASWKEDNLWIENYEPSTNTCFFREYSRGSVWQGEVKIKNCNPLLATILRQNQMEATSKLPDKIDDSAAPK